MIGPTKAYDYAPALSPEEAAEMVVDAIIHKHSRVATDMGKVPASVEPDLAQELRGGDERHLPHVRRPARGQGLRSPRWRRLRNRAASRWRWPRCSRVCTIELRSEQAAFDRPRRRAGAGRLVRRRPGPTGCAAARTRAADAGFPPPPGIPHPHRQLAALAAEDLVVPEHARAVPHAGADAARFVWRCPRRAARSTPCRSAPPTRQ